MADNNIFINIIENVEEIITEWALEKRDADKYTVNIVKNGLKFAQVGDMKYTPIEKTRKETNEKSEACAEIHPNRRCHAVYSTSFSNNTDGQQSHHFKTDRSLKTTYSWSMTSGKTFNSRAGITFSPPHSCVEASVELSRQTSKEETGSHVFEKSRSNALESTFQVNPGKKVTVAMVIEEEDFMAEYKVKYRIEGGVKVLISNNKDKKDTITKVGHAQNIFEGMRGFKVVEATENSAGFATFENRGVFVCQREISQSLDFKQEDIAVPAIPKSENSERK
ncbi:uncharacterized protein LOC144434506 [Glandiceps talaboti]